MNCNPSNYVCAESTDRAYCVAGTCQPPSGQNQNEDDNTRAQTEEEAIA